MSNVISTAIFCGKNLTRGENGFHQDSTSEELRLGIGIAQAKNVLTAIKDYDNAVGKTAKAAVDVFEHISKKEKLIDYAGKGVDFLSKNINPLICVSSGIDVLTSDDKEKAAIVQASALGAMFIGEGTMKAQFPKIKEFKGVSKIADRILKYAEKFHCRKGLPAILKGLAFVTGSTLSYAAGEKLGNVTVRALRNEDLSFDDAGADKTSKKTQQVAEKTQPAAEKPEQKKENINLKA